MKICPRCNYVDTDGRRVCLACRGSLMGVESVDPEALVASVSAARVADGPAERAVPWGPALRHLLDDVADAPDPVAAPDAHAGAPVDAAPDGARPVPAAPAATAPADPETTRRHLTRLYDRRAAAPALVDEVVARAAPSALSEAAAPAAPAPTAPARRAGPERRRAPQVRPGLGRRDTEPAARASKHRVVLGIVLVVALVIGVRAVRGALAGDDGALVRDPTTAVDRLPWHREQYGQLLVQVPTSPESRAVDAASGYTRFDRYVLPDVTLTITARAAVPGLSTDAALRTYASQVAQLGGGGIATGFARDLTFGTAFSATLEVPDAIGYLYVVSTSTEIVEIRADGASTDSGRPTRIFEQVIRSVTPR